MAGTVDKFARQLVTFNSDGDPTACTEQKSTEVMNQILAEIKSPTYQRSTIYRVRQKALELNARDPSYYVDMLRLRHEFKFIDDPGNTLLTQLRVFRSTKLPEQMKLLKEGTYFRGGTAEAQRLNARFAVLRLVPDWLQNFRPPQKLMKSLEVRTLTQIMDKSARSLVLPGDVLRGIYTTFAIPIILCAAYEFDTTGAVTSYDRGDLAVALGLVTGRREAEILLTGKFMETDKPYIATFAGQLKKKGAGRTYQIPLMAPVRYVHTAVQAVRSLYPLPANAKPSSVNARYCHTLGNAVKNKLNYLLGTTTEEEMHFHRLREIYAVTSYDVTKPRGRSGVVSGALSLHEHIRRVLGHETLETSQNYSCLQIDGTTGLHIDGFGS